MNVLFNVMSGRGHTQAGLRLASELRAKGHQVTFLCWQDAVEEFRVEGFSTVLYAENILPDSTTCPASTEGAAAQHLSDSVASRQLKKETLFESYLDHIVNGELDSRIKSVSPDVFVFDSFLWANALRAQFLGIPVVSLSIPMAFRANTKIPPVTSARKLSGKVVDQCAICFDWLKLEVRNFCISSPLLWFSRQYRHPSRFHHLTSVYGQLAKQSGRSARRNHDYVLTEFGPRLCVPEIVCAPRDLQFAANVTDPRVYWGNYVDQNRRESQGRTVDLDPDKPWVYCSLGTESQFYPHAKKFFRAIVEASRLKPEWQWILSAPDGVLDSSQQLPENLQVSNWWPQIQILRNATVMVTHGGINSILEGVEFEVPMVIVPGARDQPGNAARAESSGIAQTIPMRKIRGTALVSVVQHCAQSQSMQKCLTQIRASIHQNSVVQPAIDLIESAGLNPLSGTLNSDRLVYRKWGRRELNEWNP